MPKHRKKDTAPRLPSFELNPFSRRRMISATTLLRQPDGMDPFAGAVRRKRPRAPVPAGVSPNWEAVRGKLPARKRSRTTTAGVTDVVAIDCEMVGAGVTGKRSVLARVTVVNSSGDVLIDAYVQPTDVVTDFRTPVSGVRPRDLRSAEKGGAAQPLRAVQEAVSELITGRVVVGHALRNDFGALMLDHPKPLMRTDKSGRPRPMSLAALARDELGTQIQVGEHTPVEDARAAMQLYLKHHVEWEGDLAARQKRRGEKKKGRRKKRK